MLEDISTDLLWFIGGSFFTLLGLIWIWATTKIAIHMML